MARLPGAIIIQDCSDIINPQEIVSILHCLYREIYSSITNTEEKNLEIIVNNIIYRENQVNITDSILYKLNVIEFVKSLIMFLFRESKFTNLNLFLFMN